MKVLLNSTFIEYSFPAVRRVPPSQLGEAGEQGACYRNRQLFVLFAKPRGLRAVWLVFLQTFICSSE